MQTNKPRLSAMLSQVASVAVLRSSSLGITRLDKRASKEIDRAKNALAGTGRVVAIADCWRRSASSGDEQAHL